MKPGKKGIQRVIDATGYSWKGIQAAWKNEAAFRQEMFLLLVGVVVSSFLPVSVLEQAALIGSIILIIIVELLNSAVEAAVDRIGDEYHELSGRAKDMGSAAVFFALVLATVVWVGVIYNAVVAS
ncbi:diacylglycerol kinase [Endozoicomonas sp. OPT23]|uniref:diacylglycerol kinase n=1 Tax=Endozoicomonas sp. OPT23 TaxID=2072845 RepID=UPI00129A5924|nr:diacylglycerol kinase [Endozoicomonas sp. OPT23]MRI33016.1 diacylglycerol kinase [Endozoicomonas sp. OPT23]